MFKTATLVPIQANMIDMNLISSDDQVCLEFLGFFFLIILFVCYFQIKLINAYHERVRGTIGDLLKEQGHLEAYEWLVEQTKPIVM